MSLELGPVKVCRTHTGHTVLIRVFGSYINYVFWYNADICGETGRGGGGGRLHGGACALGLVHGGGLQSEGMVSLDPIYSARSEHSCANETALSKYCIR